MKCCSFCAPEALSIPRRGSLFGKVFACAALLLVPVAVPAFAQSSDAPTVTIRTVPRKGVSEAPKREERPAPRRRRVRRAVRPKPTPVAAAPEKPAVPERKREQVQRPRRRSKPETVEAAVLTRKPETSAEASRVERSVRSSTRRERPEKGGESAIELNARGFRLSRQGRFAEAEPFLRRAVEVRPDFAYALYNLGVVLLEQGKAFDAVRPLERTAALQPTRWEPQERLAETYAAMGRLKKSRAAAARARELRQRRSARN